MSCTVPAASTSGPSRSASTRSARSGRRRLRRARRDRSPTSTSAARSSATTRRCCAGSASSSTSSCDDPDRLAAATGSRPAIVPQGDDGALPHDAHPLRGAGDDLVTVAADRRTGSTAGCGSATPIASRSSTWIPTARALKLDRYLWTLPRLLAIEQNGDPIHAAPTALRSHRLHRRPAQEGRRDPGAHRASALTRDRTSTGGDPPLLAPRTSPAACASRCGTTRRSAWFTLHARRIDAEVLGHGKVLDDLPEEGFIQGTTATETPGVDKQPGPRPRGDVRLGGLEPAAPRDPGKRIRHEDGDEIVEDPGRTPIR